MKVVITGGAGFLGQRLARRLLEIGTLTGQNGQPERIDKLTLVDIVPASLDDPRVTTMTGDISDPAVLEQAIERDTASIFHLAAIVSGMAEAQFELGMRINLDATRTLLEICRGHGHCPRVVFTSSVAVYGGTLPPVVLDSTAVNPQTSYGAQKAIGELLVNDYSRKGFVDGRALRLPTVTVRPGKPNAAASSFASGIIREPLNGEEAVCPVDPPTRIWVVSPPTVVQCFVVAHNLSANAFGQSRVVNLPGLSVTAGEMVAALERVAGREIAARVRWSRDERIARMVATWPGAWDNSRAQTLGFPSDDNFDAVIRRYIEEERPALASH